MSFLLLLRFYELIAVVSFIGKKMVSIYSFDKLFCWLQSALVPSVISILTGIPCASTARGVLVLAPFGGGHILLAAFCSRSMRMNLEMACICHESCKVWFIYKNFKVFFPYVLSFQR